MDWTLVVRTAALLAVAPVCRIVNLLPAASVGVTSSCFQQSILENGSAH